MPRDKYHTTEVARYGTLTDVGVQAYVNSGDGYLLANNPWLSASQSGMLVTSMVQVKKPNWAMVNEQLVKRVLDNDTVELLAKRCISKKVPAYITNNLLRYHRLSRTQTDGLFQRKGDRQNAVAGAQSFSNDLDYVLDTSNLKKLNAGDCLVWAAANGNEEAVTDRWAATVREGDLPALAWLIETTGTIERWVACLEESPLVKWLSKLDQLCLSRLTKTGGSGAITGVDYGVNNPYKNLNSRLRAGVNQQDLQKLNQWLERRGQWGITEVLLARKLAQDDNLSGRVAYKRFGQSGLPRTWRDSFYVTNADNVASRFYGEPPSVVRDWHKTLEKDAEACVHLLGNNAQAWQVFFGLERTDATSFVHLAEEASLAVA